MKQKLFIVVVLICSFSCKKEKETFKTVCNDKVITSNENYLLIPNDPITISRIAIVDNCLRFTISSGGCDGNSWIVRLIDSEELLYSYPPQRNLKISFQNSEECLAVISKEFSFDIKELQVSGTKIYLNIVNSGTQILYEY